MKKEYGYIIKTLDISKCGNYGLGYGEFKYPLKKGAKVITDDWNNEPVCYGGIFGLIHETKNHYIFDKSLWVILKYEKGTEVVVYNEKIKVPYAWIVDWGDRAKIQSIFKDLTGKEYIYDFAIQDGGCRSTQTAGRESTQTAGGYSTQTAGHDSTQTAGDYSTQTAGYWSTQTAGDYSTQTAGDYSTQRAGGYSTQTAGYRGTQIAGGYSTQTAGNGSVSIIRGKTGDCKHNGIVLQILCFYDEDNDKYVYLTKIINDNKKHKLEAIKENNNWILRDTIIEEEK